MSLPQINIITPVYNGMPFIKECVESVLNQEFQDWEMIISDNGSTDGTCDYLDTINDERVTIFKQEKNLGIFGNLNFLFSKAKASITQILCADDFFVNPKSLSVIMEYWQTVPSNVGFARFNHSDSSWKSLYKFQMQFLPPIITPSESDLYFFIFGSIPGNLSNMSLRTDLFNKVGSFREDLPYAGDFEFWCRSARIVSMGIVDKGVVFVRRHPKVASNYLNQKGELYPQKQLIVNKLFDNVFVKYPNFKFYLLLHGTLQFDVLDRDSAIKALFYKNNSPYLVYSKISKYSKYCFSNFINHILYIFTLGGRIGRVFSAKLLLNKTGKLKY